MEVTHLPSALCRNRGIMSTNTLGTPETTTATVTLTKSARWMFIAVLIGFTALSIVLVSIIIAWLQPLSSNPYMVVITAIVLILVAAMLATGLTFDALKLRALEAHLQRSHPDFQWVKGKRGVRFHANGIEQVVHYEGYRGLYSTVYTFSPV